MIFRIFSFQKSDATEYNKRINQIEKEKNSLNDEILSLEHEKKNLLIQLQFLQNDLHSDQSSSNIKIEETVQLNSSREIPSIYRRIFEQQILSYRTTDEDVELTQDCEEKDFQEISHELTILSLDQKDFLNLILRTIGKLNGYLYGSKKLVKSTLLYFD